MNETVQILSKWFSDLKHNLEEMFHSHVIKNNGFRLGLDHMELGLFFYGEISLGSSIYDYDWAARYKETTDKAKQCLKFVEKYDYILDCEENRTWIDNKLKEKYPESKIIGFEIDAIDNVFYIKFTKIKIKVL